MASSLLARPRAGVILYQLIRCNCPFHETVFRASWFRKVRGCNGKPCWMLYFPWDFDGFPCLYFRSLLFFTIFSPVYARKISLSNPFHSRSAVAMHPSIVDSTQVLRGRPLDEVSTHTREELADAVSLVVLWHSLIHEDSGCKFTWFSPTDHISSPYQAKGWESVFNLSTHFLCMILFYQLKFWTESFLQRYTSQSTKSDHWHPVNHQANTTDWTEHPWPALPKARDLCRQLLRADPEERGGQPVFWAGQSVNGKRNRTWVFCFQIFVFWVWQTMIFHVLRHMFRNTIGIPFCTHTLQWCVFVDGSFFGILLMEQP